MLCYVCRGCSYSDISHYNRQAIEHKNAIPLYVHIHVHVHRWVVCRHPSSSLLGGGFSEWPGHWCARHAPSSPTPLMCSLPLLTCYGPVLWIAHLLYMYSTCTCLCLDGSGVCMYMLPVCPILQLHQCLLYLQVTTLINPLNPLLSCIIALCSCTVRPTCMYKYLHVH